MSMALNESDRDFLFELLARARQPRPAHWPAWFLRGTDVPLGWLPPERALRLAQALPQDLPLLPTPQGWVWQADHVDAQVRTQVLQHVAQALRAQGEITGWRNEAYACWGHVEPTWPYERPELFRLERAAFRYLGLRSHACHVHGFTAQGDLWCGRRALSKATDPGMLDNLAAGGLPAGEEPLHCAVREIAEEAGLDRLPSDLRPARGMVLTEREEPEGWHSEVLWVWSLTLRDGERPLNRDGEVSEFLCLPVSDVLWRLRQHEFTPDAACATAVALT